MSKAFDSPFPCMEIWKTNNSEIEKIIDSLKTSNTHGYEGISNTILNKNLYIFFTTNNNKENILRKKGNIFKRLKSPRQDAVGFTFIMFLIIVF
jgi:hypothetical protein